MAIELGVTPEHVLGCLCRLWIWADQQTIDGHGVCVTGVTLNRITCHGGFSDALKNVGWLSGDELNFTLPNFERHNGETAKTRALATKRKEKQRHANTVTCVTLKTRPEKRREDIKEKVNQKKPSSLRSPSTKITFSQWQDQLRISGDKAITDYRPVWEYAETVGLQADWIYIAWLKFKERYTEDTNNSGKRYIDWRRTFLNAVKDNWFKLWYLGDKGFTLTTTGSMADLETRA